MIARSGLRLVAIAYVGLLLLAPVGLVFYRTFEHGLGPVRQVVSTPDFLHALKLTLEIALIAVPLNTVFGVICALAIVRHRLPGVGLVNAFAPSVAAASS